MADESAPSPQYLASFVRSLGLLALPAAQQIEWLRSLPVVVDNADELALEFDDGYRLLPIFIQRGWLPTAVQEIAARINLRLLEMSGLSGAWSLDQLATDESWIAIRAAAIEALSAIDQGSFVQ